VHAEVREALQQVADLFGGAAGDHGILERLQGLGHLNDPAVREQLAAAMQALRTANLQGGPLVMDLRGTEAGQALREMLQGVAGGAVMQTISSSPAQVFINGQQVDPATLSAQPTAPQAIVEVAAQAADQLIQAPVMSGPPPSSAPSARQASIVEDAGSGGFFGWLTRLLNGR
jgi:hypothetical protein